MSFYENPNDCEKIFLQDSRDKKRTAQGARHNSGRRGGGTQGIKGSLNFPYQWLQHNDKKAYKEYVKGSVIVTTNFYNDIKNCPSVEELRAKDPAQAHTIIMEVKKNNTINIIKKHLNVSGYRLYKIYDEFNIEYEHRGSAEQQRETKAKKKADYLNAPDYVPEKKKRAYHFKDEKKPDSEVTRAKFNEMVAEAKGIQWKEETENEAPMEQTHIDTIAKKEELIPAPIAEEEFQLKYNKKNVMGSVAQRRILDMMTILYDDTKYEIKFSIKELTEE